jgi:hypothetical protein
MRKPMARSIRAPHIFLLAGPRAWLRWKYKADCQTEHGFKAVSTSSVKRFSM